MKICMIFNASDSGMGTHPSELVQNLARLGHEIHLVVPRVKAVGALAASGGIRLHFIANVGPWPSMVRVPFQAIAAAVCCRRACRKEGIRLVYFRSLHFALAVIMLNRLPRLRLVFEMNGLYAEELAVERRLSRFFRAPVRFLETLVAREATAIRTVTTGIKNDLVRRGVNADRIRVVENGANTSLFRPIEGEAIAELRSRVGIAPGEQVVAFIGRLYKWQGLDNLIRSAPAILDRCPHARFLIVGDGVIRQDLVELARQVGVINKTIFTGSVPYHEVPMYINAAQVCVVPKMVMTSGYSTLKLYEYMSCGKPVVATRTNGFEVLEGKHAGLLVDPSNTEELAGAIAKLLNEPELARQMGDNGRQYVTSNHTWERVAEQVAQVCELALCSQSKERP